MSGEPPIQRVLGKLQGAKNSGKRQWVARCPAHDDRSPSLSVKENSDGQVLLYCQAGCTTEDVLASMGLAMSDLFPPDPANNGTSGRRLEEIARYTYSDEQDGNLSQKRRYLPKDFRQFHWDGTEWKPGLNGVRRVLYRLPDVVKAREEGRVVFLVEGEKDADNLCILGLCATTSPEGASKSETAPKWRQEYSAQLSGANVVILADNDGPGRNLAHAAAQMTHPLAKSIRVVELPNLPEKGDVSDWLASGGTVDELKRLVKDAPLWSPGAAMQPTGASPAPTTPRPEGTTVSLAVRQGSTITPKRIEWRWRLRLSTGRYHEIVGFPGIGKTALVMDMIGRLTTGDGWPDGEPCAATDVLIVAAEDEAEDVLIPRLMAASANLERVHFVDGIRRGEHVEELDLSQTFDFSEVRQLVAKTGAGLIYIDALDDVLGSNHDGRGNAETRRALAPIRLLARQTGATVLGLRHPTKRVALGPALNNGNGSIAYSAVCRGSMLVVVDPKDPDTRLLLATKSNISRLAPTLRFRLKADSEDSPPKISWDGADARDAETVLDELRAKEQESGEDEASKLDQAVAIVQECLDNSWLPVAQLNRMAMERGVAAKTLRRAKEKLDLQHQRDGKERRWLCALPEVPFSPTGTDMGEKGSAQLARAAEVPVLHADGELAPSRPSVTCPSKKEERWASSEESATGPGFLPTLTDAEAGELMRRPA